MPDSNVPEQIKAIEIKFEFYDSLIYSFKRNLKKYKILQNVFSWSKNTGNRELFLKLKNEMFEKK